MKSRKTRERILDVSLELFNQKKASNVSTVQISAAMNISPGNLYYYYANKEDVIRCIWEERMTELSIGLAKDAENVNTEAELFAFVEKCVAHMIEYKFFYTELSTLFSNDNKLIKLYGDVEVQVRESLSNLLGRWIENKAVKQLSDDEKAIFIENAVAIANQLINLHEVYKLRGVKDEEFIGLCWIRFIALMKPYFEEDTIKSMNEALSAKGFSKERYLEILK